VFKATRNWPAVKDMIPGMMDSLASDPNARKYTPGLATPASKDNASEISTNFSAIFKQLFCVAAHQLANTMHEPIESLGVLFEEPLETGALHLSPSAKTLSSPHKLSIGSKQSDVEREGNILSIGRGKYLFLNRRLSKADAESFAAMGFRFGSIQQVFEVLAKAMEVPNERMRGRLERMKLFATVEHLPPPGVHVACFMLRPSVHKSFDVLVPTKIQTQLPMTTLQSEPLNDWQSALLNRFDEWTVKEILKTLINESGCQDTERDFRWQLHSSIIRLLEAVGEFDDMMAAKFSAKQIQTPCRTTSDDGPMSSVLVTIRLMNTIHSRPQGHDMVYIPLSFFSAQQQVDSLKPNHEAFARRVKMEFGYKPRQLTDPSVPRMSMKSSRRTSVGELRYPRIPDSDGSRPTSLLRIKNALLPATMRRSEESSFVRPRDNGEGDGKSGSVFDDVDAVAPTPPAGTPVERDTFEDIGINEQSDTDRQDFEYEGGDRSPSGIELVAMGAEDSGSWVTELFGLFGLGVGGARTRT
jgi:hypothetical protein